MSELLAPTPTSEVLPSSRAKSDIGIKSYGATGMRMVPVFCANCGIESGMYVLESDWDAVKSFSFWLCDERYPKNCYSKWAALAGTGVTPDEVFWAKVKQAQLEKFGRELTAPEIIEALKDENHIIYKLSKERPTNV